MTRLLLDTCAVLWISQDDRLQPAARRQIEEAIEGGFPILVSPITAWEIGMLVGRGRISLSNPPLGWFDRFMAAPGIALTPLTPKILIDSSFLPGNPPSDPVDRMLATTARELGCALVTRDSKLLAYSDLGHLQTLPC